MSRLEIRMHQRLGWGGALLLLSMAVRPAAAEVTFAPEVLIESPGGTVDIAVVDLDGDQDLDIAALEGLFSGNIFVNVLRNDGRGGFESPVIHDFGPLTPLDNGLSDLACGDLDGDQDIDLAFIGSITPLTLTFNNGDGTFSPAVDTGFFTDIGQLTGILDIGDLNEDDHLDIAFGRPGRIAFNDGSGAFVAVDFVVDSNADQIEIADLDGDQINDIAFGFRTYVNDGTGSFTQAGAIPGAGARDCALDDLDGDGDIDVACASLLHHELRVALNHGDSTFADPVANPTDMFPVQVLSADLNGDEHRDLVVTHIHFGSPIVAVYEGRGGGLFDEPQLMSQTPGDALGVGDLNGDGLDDLVLGGGNLLEAGAVNILINTTAPPTPGDLDGDGVVGIRDLLMMLAGWGPCPEPPEACPPDLNGDGVVGVGDLLILLSNWG